MEEALVKICGKKKKTENKLLLSLALRYIGKAFTEVKTCDKVLLNKTSMEHVWKVQVQIFNNAWENLQKSSLFKYMKYSKLQWHYDLILNPEWLEFILITKATPNKMDFLLKFH